MDQRIILFALLGSALIAALFVKERVRRLPLSLPLIYVLVGWLSFMVLDLPLLNPFNSEKDTVILEYLSEFIVIVSLAAAGIAVDRRFSWRSWKQVWPLLAITMPLSIITIALLGVSFLGMSVAGAILLAAVLSPTDPVLAESVQVGPPGDNERDDVRFGLTLEAGINDSLAFPFTYLAIAAVGMSSIGMWTLEWFAVDFVYRIIVGGGVGYGLGRFVTWLVFRFSREDDQSADADEAANDESHAVTAPSLQLLNEGLVVFGLILASYGFAEIVGGYGFLAVFVAAVAAKQYDRSHKYHVFTHHFVAQIEQVVLIIMLLGIGGLLAGGILSSLTLPGAIISLLLLLIIRPITGYVAQLRSPLPKPGRLAVAFLGIRGIGTIYYVAYAQHNGDFAYFDISTVWSISLFVIISSIILHGSSAKYVMDYVNKTESNLHHGSSRSDIADEK